jgi:hypothetical protein
MKERSLNKANRRVTTYKIVRKDEGQALGEIAEKVIPKLKAAQKSFSASGYAGEIGAELEKVIEYTERGLATHGGGVTTRDEEGAILELQSELQSAEEERMLKPFM